MDTKHLTKFQKIIAKIFGAHLVAYEHRHPNKHSKGMLLRNQSWYRFIKIIVYYYSLFKFHQIRFNIDNESSGIGLGKSEFE